MAKLNFSYDKKNTNLWQIQLINLLDDLKNDRLTDEGIAKAFVEFDLSDEDFRELLKLLTSAQAKQIRMTWVVKKEMAEHLGISEKTIERFQDNNANKILLNVHIKKVDGKMKHYHIKNFASLYQEITNQKTWEDIIDNTGKDWKLDADGKPVIKKNKR